MDALYREVMRASLAVKDWIEAEGLGAFTLNFLEAGKNTGLRHMVFDRACRAIEEGVGYAGEGDALTAALVGALLTSFPETTFVEMFCPSETGEAAVVKQNFFRNTPEAGIPPVTVHRQAKTIIPALPAGLLPFRLMVTKTAM